MGWAGERGLTLGVWDWFQKINFVEGGYLLIILDLGSKYRGI